MSAERKLDTQVGPSAEEVAEYLRRHPDFFEQQLPLLAELQVPHPCGEARSLLERQVSVLRSQTEHYRGKLEDLLSIARENDRLNERMQRLILALFDANCLDDMLSTLEDELCNTFSADLISLTLLGDHEVPLPQMCQALAADSPQLHHFKHIIKTRKPLCGRLSNEQQHLLFGDRASELGSSAVIPLGDAELYGLLAIGSHNPNHFQSDMGTLFLTHIGRLLIPLLRRFQRQKAG